MIQIQKTLTVIFDTDVTYFDYTLSSNKTCVSFSKATDRVQGYQGNISFIVSFTDEACLDTAVLTISATSDTGCTKSSTFTVANPCNSLTVAIASEGYSNGLFIFSATPGGGQPNFSYKWTFDAGVFEAPGSTTQATLQLRTLSGVTLPATTNIRVQVTDENSCSAFDIYNYSFCAPVAEDAEVSLGCVPLTSTTNCKNMAARSPNLFLSASTCDGITIDWSTIEFTVPGDLCIEVIEDNQIVIYGKEVLSTNLLTATYRVKNDIGVISNTASIDVLLPACVTATVNPIRIQSQQIPLTAAQKTPATDIVVPIYITSEQDIDWDSFTFVAGTGQTLVTATQLTGTNGTATLTANREVNYNTTSQVCNVDGIMFIVSDEDGVVSNRARYHFDWENTVAPTAVADSDTVAAGGSISIKLFSNDTGDINPNSLVITQAPTEGTYALSDDDNLFYTANEGPAGSDTIKYRVSNPDGDQSNEATVTITIISAGESGTLYLCAEGTVNLETALGAGFTAGGAWAQDPGNPDTVSLASPTAVDFTGKNEGSYKFTYTVTAGPITDVATVTVEFEIFSISYLVGTLASGVISVKYSVTGSVESADRIKVEVYKDTTPVTPSASNLHDIVSLDSYDPVTKVGSLAYTAVIDGEYYVLRGVLTDDCGGTDSADSGEFLPV